MFRQVVAIRWAEGVSVEDKQGFRDALDGLRLIPELLALTWETTPATSRATSTWSR